MIIQLKGLVTFPITLDASVWIFDDRKIILEEAFVEKEQTPKEDPLKKAGQLFDQELYFETKVKPPVNKSLNRYERDQALKHSFVMPIGDFIRNAEIKEGAAKAILTTNEDDVIISLEQLLASFILFSEDGKPVREGGPVHLYFGDGSNRANPIKGVRTITIA